MKFERLTTNLIVKDVDKTLDFYQDVLKFAVVLTLDNNGKHDWALLKAGNFEIMIQELDHAKNQYPTKSDLSYSKDVSIYISINDIENYYNSIKDKVELLNDIKEGFNGMKEFSILDINGIIFKFSGVK